MMERCLVIGFTLVVLFVSFSLQSSDPLNHVRGHGEWVKGKRRFFERPIRLGQVRGAEEWLRGKRPTIQTISLSSSSSSSLHPDVPIPVTLLYVSTPQSSREPKKESRPPSITRKRSLTNRAQIGGDKAAVTRTIRFQLLREPFLRLVVKLNRLKANRNSPYKWV